MTLLMTVKTVIQRIANMVPCALKPTGQTEVGKPKGKLCNGYSNLLGFFAAETIESLDCDPLQN